MSTRIARIAFFALGLIAVSALLFQPICEAAEHLAHAQTTSHTTPAGGHNDDSCCSVFAAAGLSIAAPVAYGSNAPVAAPAVGALVFRPQIVISHALPAAAPPLVLRYYVRSARIQR